MNTEPDALRSDAMELLEILKLHQSELYDQARDRLLPGLQKDVNEHGAARLIEERVRSEKLDDLYADILLWVIAFDDFKSSKPHHNAAMSRRENAREIATWFFANWQDDPYERRQVVTGLAMASPDQRLRSALILFEIGNVPS